MSGIIVFLILWAFIGALIFGDLMKSWDFDRMNNYQKFFMFFLLGPLVFIAFIIKWIYDGLGKIK